jgi:transporter associated domain
MGNIDDEYDEPIELIKKIGDNIYLVDGTIPLHDLNRELSIHIRRESE